MHSGGRIRCLALGGIFVLAHIPQALAQGTMVRPRPESTTSDSSGLLKAHPTDAIAHGSVLLPDGSAPQQLVEIYAGCDAAHKFVGVADSKGKVSISLSLLAITNPSQECSWLAAVDGYHSETKPVTDINLKSGAKLGTIALQPLLTDTSILFSRADGQASKSQMKMLRNAVDETARQHWSTGLELLAKATAAYPSFGSAWLTFGILQQNQGDLANAEKSFLEAVRSDPKFASPLIRAATLEAARGDWKAARDHSEKAIALNPAAFPGAYAINAIANVSLQNPEAAEKSAREGLRLDTDHQFPELEYSLGVVLYTKDDKEGATKHLQAYVDASPGGPNAATAQIQLAQLAKPKPDETAPLEVIAGPRSVNLPFQARNAALLEKAPLHTCLETIARSHTDTHGQFKAAEIKRVEIAIADGNEIYAQAGGKSFSNQALPDMVGYTFSTTGLFGSIARALMAGNGVAIQPAGEEVLDGAPVLRYTFQSLPGSKGWTIQDGKNQGSAGEQGWFLVDRESLTLRRVSVQATAIPPNLKLKQLRAVIDYEIVTIAGRQVLLPSIAQVSAAHSSGSERESKILFDHCHMFGSESTLSFDGENGSTQNYHASKVIIPADLEIAVALSAPMSPAAAAVSDLVTGAVVRAVSANGHQLIAHGAAVQGHVRVRRAENSVVIELDQVQTASGWSPFYAHLVSITPSAPARITAEDPEVPGVAKLIFVSKSAELPAGTTMIWKTESLADPTEARPPQLDTSINLR